MWKYQYPGIAEVNLLAASYKFRTNVRVKFQKKVANILPLGEEHFTFQNPSSLADTNQPCLRGHEELGPMHGDTSDELSVPSFLVLYFSHSSSWPKHKPLGLCEGLHRQWKENEFRSQAPKVQIPVLPRRLNHLGQVF